MKPTYDVRAELAKLRDKMGSSEIGGAGDTSVQLEALLDRGVATSADLVSVARSPSDALSGIAIWALGRIDVPDVAGTLLDVLASDRREVWMESAVSLSLTASAPEVARLLALLDIAREADRREAIVYALAFIADEDVDHAAVADRLARLVAATDEDPAVRGQAAEGVGSLLQFSPRRSPARMRAVAALHAALGDESPIVRFWSVFGLELLEATEHLETLRSMVGDEGMVPGWWTVGEEARDAIMSLEGGEPPDRIP